MRRRKLSQNFTEMNFNGKLCGRMAHSHTHIVNPRTPPRTLSSRNRNQVGVPNPPMIVPSAPIRSVRFSRSVLRHQQHPPSSRSAVRTHITSRHTRECLHACRQVVVVVQRRDVRRTQVERHLTSSSTSTAVAQEGDTMTVTLHEGRLCLRLGCVATW